MNKDLIEDKYGRYFKIPKYLSESMDIVNVLCLDYYWRRDDYINKLEEGKLLIQSYSLGIFKIFGFVCFLLAIKNNIKKNNIDVIVGASDALQVIIAFFISKIYRKKYVIDLYDNYESYRFTHIALIRYLFKKAVKYADKIAVITPELKSYIADTYNVKGTIYVVENAIDENSLIKKDRVKVRKEFNLPVENKLIGTFGALSFDRGVDYLIKAFIEIRSGYPDYSLVLAGKLAPGLLPENLSEIYYLGELSLERINALYNALDVGVICNLNNEFGKYCHPQKACEMFSNNLPIVAANVGSMKRILKDYPHMLYRPVEYKDLKKKIISQIKLRETVKIPVKTWRQQSDEMYRLISSTVN